jgi:hypothetical protein
MAIVNLSMVGFRGLLLVGVGFGIGYSGGYGGGVVVVYGWVWNSARDAMKAKMWYVQRNRRQYAVN